MKYCTPNEADERFDLSCWVTTRSIQSSTPQTFRWSFITSWIGDPRDGGWERYSSLFIRVRHSMLVISGKQIDEGKIASLKTRRRQLEPALANASSASQAIPPHFAVTSPTAASHFIKTRALHSQTVPRPQRQRFNLRSREEGWLPQLLCSQGTSASEVGHDTPPQARRRSSLSRIFHDILVPCWKIVVVVVPQGELGTTDGGFDVLVLYLSKGKAGEKIAR